MASLISIRRSLLTNLVPVVLLLGVGIFTMMALSTRRAVQDLSSSLIQQASRRTEVKLQGFFGPVSRQVEAVRRWGERGLLSLDEPEQLRALLPPLMLEFPWSSAVFIANEQGREYLLRQADKSWTSRQIWRDKWNDRAFFQTWQDGSPTPEGSEGSVEGYDPRLRPWFEGAAALLAIEEGSGESAPVFWTEPYRFFSTGKPGITAAMAFRDGQGLLTVVGIDLALTEISRFTSAIHLLDDSTVFVLTEDGRMVGVPRPTADLLPEEELERLLLQRPEELGTTAAQDAAERLIDDSRGWGLPVRLVSEGQAWWGQITPFELSTQQRLLIGVAVGEKAILGRLERQRYWVIGITLAALALAVWRAARMARGYSRPVEMLAQESERISTGDLEPGPAIQTRIAEVHQLTEAHNRMRTGLRTLLKLEGDLQVARRIQESTLPDKLPILSGIDLSAWSAPADETGGDTYDVIGLTPGGPGQGLVLTEGEADRALLMLADATGHGVGPALSVTQLRAMLRMAIRLDADFTALANNINQQLTADLPRGMFITAWFGLLDTSAFTLSTFSAGQAPLLRYSARGDDFEVLESNAVPLGLFPTLEIDLPDPIQLEPGDIYAVLSDGLFEAKSRQGIEQGTERICKVIQHHHREPAAVISQRIRAATEEFTQGAPADDDRTIIIIKRL
jgi:serine phosphatase RsbU (regulator of sigma subunit)